MPTIVAKRFGLELADAEAWYSTVRITAERFVSEATLAKTLEVLGSAGVLSPEAAGRAVDTLVDARLGELRADIKSMTLYKRPELVRLLQHLFFHSRMHSCAQFHHGSL